MRLEAMSVCPKSIRLGAQCSVTCQSLSNTLFLYHRDVTYDEGIIIE